MTLAVVVATESVVDDGSIVTAPTAALQYAAQTAMVSASSPSSSTPSPVKVPAASAAAGGASPVSVATRTGAPQSAAGAAGTAIAAGPAGQTVLDRLLEQLDSLDVTDRRIIARRELAPALRERGHEVIESDDLAGDLREISRLVRGARRPVLLVHGDVVTHTEQLARVVLGNKSAAAAVIARGRPNGGPLTRPLVRVESSRIVSAGSPFHQVTDPNGVFLGMLWVSAAETRRLSDVARELAELVETPGALRRVDPIRYLNHDPDLPPVPKPDTRDPAFVEQLRRLRVAPVTGDDAPSLLLTGLIRSGVRVSTRRVRVLQADRVLTQAEADAGRRALAMVDEDKVKLTAAVKSNDGFFTTYAVSTYSRYIARWTARHGLTPNMVTSFSMALSVVAAFWFASGNRIGMILGGLFLYFAFVFDCVDGQLARYSRQFSTLGAWLDATFDRAKEYTVFAGLAVGSTAAAATSSVHSGDVWALAVAAMVMQTSRHMVDFAFGAARRRKPPVPVPLVPLTDPDDSVIDKPRKEAVPLRRRGLGRIAVGLSSRTERIPGTRWAKKIIVLPIGERFALIALSAAIFNARVTFLCLLTWGATAFLYTATGRFLRSLAK